MIRYCYILFFTLIISCSSDMTLKEAFIPEFDGFPPTENVVMLDIEVDSIDRLDKYLQRLIEFEAEVIVLAGVLFDTALITPYIDSIFQVRRDVLQIEELDEDVSVVNNSNLGMLKFNTESLNDTLDIVTSFNVSSENSKGLLVENIAFKVIREYYTGIYKKKVISNAVTIKFYGGFDAYILISPEDIDWIIRDKIVIVSILKNEPSYYTPHGLIYSEYSDGFIKMKMKQSYILANMINTLINNTPDELGIRFK